MNPNPPPAPPSPATAPQKTNTLAIVALVMSVLGLCLLPCIGQLAAIVLGIMALVKIQKTKERGMGLAIAALIIPAISVPLMGVMAAIAVPNFMKFQARSKQAECKTHLKALHVAQRSFHAEKDAYSPDPKAIGFAPDQQRYAYFLSDDPQHWLTETVHGAPLTEVPDVGTIGIEGECPECHYTAVCAANIDQDETLDVWFISSEDKELDDGQVIPAGTPHNLTNDVTD